MKTNSGPGSQGFGGVVVYSRDGSEKGVATGATRRCQLHGCTGVRVVTLWADGKTTYPCSKGMRYRSAGVAQIA